jgi:Reeler domain
MIFINYKIGTASFAILTILLGLIGESKAFPGFTSSCTSGNPLGGSHLKANSRGSLSTYGLQLKIGNTVISEGNTATVPSGNSLPISLVSTNGKSFRGFQIRVSKQGIQDTSRYLAVATDSAVQVDSFCTSIGVGGLSHNSKRDKQRIEGTFKPPSIQIDGLKIEVVVVVSNGPSVWYRSEFLVNVKGSLPSASPMASVPSSKPVKKPSKPTKRPTPFPTTKKRPTPAPTFRTPPPVPMDDDGETQDDDGETQDDDSETQDDGGFEDKDRSSFWNL